MISIIVAIAQNGVIGGENSLLWHISEDLQRFKRITGGHTVVMGRKTYESIGRPLPNRTNVVITRQTDYKAEGCTIVNSLEAAIEMSGEEVFIIGGGEIYARAMPLADRFYLTRVCADYEGDVSFPEWNAAEWDLVDSERHERGEAFPHPFEFLTYDRKR